MEQRKRLGEIFVAQGIITEKTVERVLELSRLLGRRFGTILEEMSLVTGDELAAALAIQYGFKIATNLVQHDYPQDLLHLVPGEVAMNNLIFPIRREGNKLAMAMADPTETRVVSNIAADNGLEIVPVIASRKDIFAAICRHYLGRESNPSDLKTVLIVEDDRLELTILSNILTKHGYRVVTAPDGMEGFKAVIAEKPQVIITDKVMPKMDGYGLFDALQKVTETMFIPVILVTGAMNADEEERAFGKGFYDFIVKPVRDVTLLTRVKRAFFFYEHHYRLI
jgi:CheY-like chemotaxis protein